MALKKVTNFNTVNSSGVLEIYGELKGAIMQKEILQNHYDKQFMI
jgi:hypothetical protein